MLTAEEPATNVSLPATDRNEPARGGAVIALESLSKTYSEVVAVRDFNLPVEGGEFCTLLGPSGSGKTTTLMMIAGFVQPTRGRILINGSDVTRLPPQRRGLGVVFQNYALFPHMSVFDNVAFPLAMRHVPGAEVRELVPRMLKIVELTGFEKRLPYQLSGGQQQRVALARALVFEPTVLLMDEPLGALDKKLRASLQLELKHLQRRLNVTVIYVTHDQEEALTMSDKIVVMRDGMIDQVGTPEDLYERPETAFVADFIGEANFVTGVVTATTAEFATIEHPAGRTIRGVCAHRFEVGADAVASMRPEQLWLATGRPTGDDENSLPGRVTEITYLGEAIKYHVIVGEARPRLAQTLVVRERARSDSARFAEGDAVHVVWPVTETRLLDGRDDVG